VAAVALGASPPCPLYTLGFCRSLRAFRTLRTTLTSYLGLCNRGHIEALWLLSPCTMTPLISPYITLTLRHRDHSFNVRVSLTAARMRLHSTPSIETYANKAYISKSTQIGYFCNKIIINYYLFLH